MTTIAPPSSSAIETLPALPRLSLAPGIEQWCHKYIRQPDGPDAGGPWEFTKEQKRFLWCLYAVADDGRFIWSRAVLRRAKGWGKSPFMAALALAELCGPVRYDPVASALFGRPVGMPVALPLVQIAGFSQKQTDNTFSMVLAMINESPIVEDYGLDPGLTRINTVSGGKLVPITASAPTEEGARPTFCVLDESHLWLSTNGGHKLAEVIRRNLGKSRDGAARSVETTNAHKMGEDSVAERSYTEWTAQQTGQSRASNILYDSLEAPPDTELADEESLMRGLRLVYGDSTWAPLERIRDEIYDGGTPVGESRRFYLNQLHVGEDAWMSPQHWDAIADENHIVPPEAMVTIAFDGSITDDFCALALCEVETGHIQTLGIWDPRNYQGEAPRERIHAEVERAFAIYDVVGFYSDLYPWTSDVDTWAQRWGDQLCVKASPHSPVGWDMRARRQPFAAAAEAFNEAVVAKDFTHDGNKIAAQHVYNARRNPIGAYIGITKEHHESLRKIDFAVTAVLARLARQDYLALPDSRKRRRRTGRAAFFN